MQHPVSACAQHRQAHQLKTWWYGIYITFLDNLSRCAIHVSDATAGERKEDLVTGSKQAKQSVNAYLRPWT